MSRPDKDEYYLRIAEVVSTRSTCQRRQVGCVITDKAGKILSTGYNGVPAGRQHCRDNLRSQCQGRHYASGEGLELCEAIHAEQNALIQLTDMNNAWAIYSTDSPCIHCVKMLLNTPIQFLVFRREYPHTMARRMWELESGRKWIGPCDDCSTLSHE